MQRKYRLGDGLLTTADLEAMNKEDFTTIGAFVQEFKKRARKVHGISEEAKCAIFLGLLTASEAVELTRHGGGSTKLTWATIDRWVEVGCLDQVEQRQARLQRQKRKERDATASGTPGVTRIVTDVLAQLGYATEPVVQRRVVTAVQVKGKEPVIEEVVQEELLEEEELVPQRLTNAQRKGNQGQGYPGQGYQGQGDQGSLGYGRPRFDWRTAICQHCDQQGHTIRFCNIRREDERSGMISSTMDGNIYDQFGEAIDRRLGGVRAEAQRRAATGPSPPATIKLWQEKEEPPIGVEEVGNDEEVTQGPRGGSRREEPIIIESDDEDEERRMKSPSVLLRKMEHLLKKVGRYLQKLVDLCDEVKRWRSNIPKVFLYDSVPESASGRPEVNVVGSCPQSGMMGRPLTSQARLAQAARTRNQAKASASQEPPRREPEPGKRKEAVEVEDDDNEEEEDERLRREEDQKAEQRARQKGARGEVEPVVCDGPPKRKKYAVQLEERVDVERVIDRLLERHNDFVTLKEILASAPRLRDELKGRLSRRLVSNVHLGTILPKEGEWAESGTKMDWKCVACDTVDLVVKGSKCATMVDTGAEMNIIREADAIRFGLDIDRYECGILHGASCKAVFCGRASNVLIEVGNVKARACFLIMSDVDHGILLGRNRPNPGSFTIEESEGERRRLRAEPEGEEEVKAFSLSLSDIGKVMDLVAAHEMADPDAIQDLREQVLECPEAGRFELVYRLPDGRKNPASSQAVSLVSPHITIDDLTVKGPAIKESDEVLPGVRRFVSKHIEDLDKVLSLLEEHNLTASGAKSRHCMREATILGFVCSEKGRRPDVKKTDKITEWPVLFHSITDVRSFLERNYSQFKRETLAVLHCLRIFRNYIFGRRFILRVDPTALTYSLRNYVPSDPMVARWLTYIWMFNFELERIPGSKNQADGLSRINWDNQEGEAVENTPPVDGFLDQEEDVRLHINNWSLRVPSCVGYPIWQAPIGYERRAELVLKPFEEEDPWGGNVDEVSESQDDEFEEGEIKETFHAEEYDGIYLELGLLLSCEMRLRDAALLSARWPPLRKKRNGESQESRLRSDFTKTTMPKGGKGTRPPQRPLGALGGYERHGLRHRDSTPVYDDGDIELFLDYFWDHARRMGWTVAQAIERLRGAGRFEEPVVRIRREATTRSEVEWRMQELRPSPVGPDGTPIHLEIGNASDFIPAFEWFMQGQGILRDDWMQTLPLWTRKAERPLASQVRSMARDWESCRAHLREAFRQPEPPQPRVERRQRSQRQRDPEPREARPSRGGRKALARREEEPKAEERGAYPECGLGPVEFHRFAEGELRRSPTRTPEGPASEEPLRELEAHLDISQWRASPRGEERGEQAEEVPREEVPQEEVQDTRRERGLDDEGRRAGKEVIEVGEDTPPQTPATPSSSCLEHPDLEEPTPVEPRQEPCQPEKEIEAEIPKRVDLRTRDRAPAGGTAEEKRARRTRRIDEIWQERQRLEAVGELPEQQQERQRSEAAGPLPGQPPAAPARAPEIPEMWRDFWE
ncbi:hypothetical protein CBR_g60131 [Chara braunii]|uniref:RNA-directed DNA polymerase n=1 Tax=Chara braunii TaxID=69332 RepID=A0A388MF51_CHABU|nr:hypothetical protein CBR_g60131 [Chara braunii]|eukprot:GBG93181.1 hypothetical protein CBR_g60131 [Chara braunii]